MTKAWRCGLTELASFHWYMGKEEIKGGTHLVLTSERGRERGTSRGGKSKEKITKKRSIPTIRVNWLKIPHGEAEGSRFRLTGGTSREIKK